MCVLTLSRPPPRVGAAPKGRAALGRTGPRRSVTRTLREAEKPSSNFPEQESGFPSQRTPASSFLSFLSGLRAAAPWQAQEPAPCGAEPGQGPLVTQPVQRRWPSVMGKVEGSREGPHTTPRRPAPGRDGTPASWCQGPRGPCGCQTCHCPPEALPNPNPTGHPPDCPPTCRRSPSLCLTSGFSNVPQHPPARGPGHAIPSSRFVHEVPPPPCTEGPFCFSLPGCPSLSPRTRLQPPQLETSPAIPSGWAYPCSDWFQGLVPAQAWCVVRLCPRATERLREGHYPPSAQPSPPANAHPGAEHPGRPCAVCVRASRWVGVLGALGAAAGGMGSFEELWKQLLWSLFTDRNTEVLSTK